MLPSELTVEQFKAYPPQARQLASGRVALFRQLPASFAPVLLREVIAYDWKFPAERKDLDRQLAYLGSLSPDRLQQAMTGFAQVRLSSELERLDWVNSPEEYSDRLSAYLWASHQIDAFHRAAVDYLHRYSTAAPPEPPAMARLGIVVLGQGVADNSYPLFRKLRPHGVYFKQVSSENGFKILLDAVAARATAHPVPYAHWYVDGGTEEAVSCAALSRISYNSLAPVRTALLNKMEKAIQSGIGGPEALRTMMTRLRPEELGLSGGDAEAVLNRFQVNVLTEGSGTQIFSTIFVQWTAREALRRAQPVTLLARFAPRQRQRPMNELISGKPSNTRLDPEGSLVDADMGAYLTWLNQQRLAGAEQSSFLAWFEDHHEALAIAPSLPRGTESSSAIDLDGLLGQMT
ncbi:MAG TPA: hypothetical protein VI455_08765 [Terriglobia bacterium]